jgi:site-specific DNA-methyltransferase (adenine-specific)
MPVLMGSFLKSKREALGFSRQAFAEVVGVTVCEVTWWETAGHLPDIGILTRVATALQTSVDLLYLNTGWIPPERVPYFESTLNGTVLADSQPKTQLQASAPVFQTSLGQLFKGDCIEVMSQLSDRTLDCIFADPPFNLDKQYGDGIDDNLAEQDYLNWSYRWLAEAVRLLKYGGSLFLYNIPKWNIHLAAYLERFLQFRNWIAIDIKCSLPIQGRLYPSHYSLLYFVKGARPNCFNPPRLPLQACRHCGGELKDYGGYKGTLNPRGINLADVWYDIPPVRHKRYKNRGANELSIKLLDRVLDIATTENDTVLDPFAGSGTTLATCELRGRRWVGVELGDCQPIVERMLCLDAEREQLTAHRAEINTLFTANTLRLRNKHGHDTTRYQQLPEEERIPSRKKGLLKLHLP